MVTGVLGLAIFFAMSKASEIAHNSASNISFFFPKHTLFSFHLAGFLYLDNMFENLYRLLDLPILLIGTGKLRAAMIIDLTERCFLDLDNVFEQPY